MFPPFFVEQYLGGFYMKKATLGIIFVFLFISILLVSCNENNPASNATTEKNQTITGNYTSNLIATTGNIVTEQKTTIKNNETQAETKPTDSEKTESVLKEFQNAVSKLDKKNVQSQNIQNINIYGVPICRYGDYIIYHDESNLYCKKASGSEAITLLSDLGKILGLKPIDGQNICINIAKEHPYTEYYQFNLTDGTKKIIDSNVFKQENAKINNIIWVNDYVLGSVSPVPPPEQPGFSYDYFIKLPNGKIEKLENTWDGWVVDNILYYQLTEDFDNIYKCGLDGSNKSKIFTSDIKIEDIGEYIVQSERKPGENEKLIFNKIKTNKKYFVDIESDMVSTSHAIFIYDENIAYGFFNSTRQVAKIDIINNTYSIISKGLNVKRFAKSGDAIYLLTEENELYSVKTDGTNLKKF